MTEASAVEKIVNGSFSVDANWVKGANWSISGGVANISNPASFSNIYQSIPTIYGWYKITYEVLNYTSGFCRFHLGGFESSNYGISRNANGIYFEYKKLLSNQSSTLFFVAHPNSIYSIDNVSCKIVGWQDSEELYNGLIAQGMTAANALKEVTMWAYQNNDVNYHYFGKVFNGYAKNQIAADIAATPNWGWRLPTEAEATQLISQGNGLKAKGTDYWTSSNGTNRTGFTALGGGMRNPDGTWSGVKDSVDIWVGDVLKVLRIRNSGTHSIVSVDANHGAFLRMIKD
jgi:uncharacterized protein (TIGR02145 family)